MKEPELVALPGFTACGISTPTSAAIESEPAMARLPRLWQRFYAEAMPARLAANASNGRVVCVYSGYEAGGSAGYRVTIGVQLVRGRACPTGAEQVAVSPGEYLRFTAYGHGPEAAARAWHEIGDFFKHAEHALAGRYERAYTADFERYGDPESVSILVAVKRKLGVHLAADRARQATRQV